MLGKLFVFACIVCVRRASSRPTIQEIKELSDRVLVNYSRHILPSNTYDYYNPFNIYIIFDLVAIGGIDEIEEKLSTVLHIHYEWKDESIQWDLKDTNVTYIVLGWSEVWTPVFHVTNPQTDSSQAQKSDLSYGTVAYRFDGWAYYDELVTTRTTCDMDMSYYPFDIQTCEIKMTMIEITKYWFNLTVNINKQNTEHGSWDLTSITSSAEDDFGSFVIKLVFERYPLFLLLNVVLPLYILALLTPVVFLLPKKSGERVGYCVAMLLAISVYMTIVSDHLPKKSKPAPLLTILVFTGYVFDAVVVLVVIVNTKINLKSPNSPVPFACSAFVKLTRKMVCQSCSKLKEKCSKQQNCNEVEPVDNDKDGSDGMHNAAFDEINGKDVNVIDEENGKDVNVIDEENGKDVNVNVTWQELSHAIDKWCFVISCIMKGFMPVIFFIVMVKSQP